MTDKQEQPTEKEPEKEEMRITSLPCACCGVNRLEVIGYTSPTTLMLRCAECGIPQSIPLIYTDEAPPPSVVKKDLRYVE